MTDNEILALNECERTPCEVWSRCMGYFRPYSHYNIGKKSEFDERKWFVEDKVSEFAERKLFVEDKACACELRKVN